MPALPRLTARHRAPPSQPYLAHRCLAGPIQPCLTEPLLATPSPNKSIHDLEQTPPHAGALARIRAPLADTDLHAYTRHQVGHIL